MLFVKAFKTLLVKATELTLSFCWRTCIFLSVICTSGWHGTPARISKKHLNTWILPAYLHASWTIYHYCNCSRTKLLFHFRGLLSRTSQNGSHSFWDLSSSWRKRYTHLWVYSREWRKTLRCREPPEKQHLESVLVSAVISRDLDLRLRHNMCLINICWIL